MRTEEYKEQAFELYDSLIDREPDMAHIIHVQQYHEFVTEILSYMDELEDELKDFAAMKEDQKYPELY